MIEKPKLKRDWIGRRVQLLRTLRTRAGVTFPEGSIMVVGNNKGALSLRTPEPNRSGSWQGRSIRRVHEVDVRLLPHDA